MSRDVRSRRPHTAHHPSIRPPVFHRQTSAAPRSPTSSPPGGPRLNPAPVKAGTVREVKSPPSSSPSSSDSEGAGMRWEMSFQRRLQLAVAHASKDLPLSSHFDSNLSDIEATLASVPKADAYVQRPAARQRAAAAPDRAGEEHGAYKDAAIAELQREIRGLKATISNQDAEIKRLKAARTELQLANTRLEGMLARQQQVERSLDLRGLQHLQVEAAFQRLDKQCLFDALLRLTTAEGAPGQRLALLQAHLTQRHKALAAKSLRSLAEVLPADPAVYCGLPESITDLFNGKDFGLREAVQRARHLLQVHTSELRVRPPLGRVAACFADIPDAPALWQADVDAAKASLALCHKELEHLARGFRGFLVRAEAYGWFFTFSNACDAVLFCTHATLQLLRANWPPRVTQVEGAEAVRDGKGQSLFRGPRVRMAVHVGEAVTEHDDARDAVDYFGPVFGTCSRLCSMAQPGQLLCTDDVYEDVRATAGRPAGPLRFQHIASVPFEGVDRPLGLYEFLPAELAGRTFPTCDLALATKKPGESVPGRSRGEAMLQQWWPQVPDWQDSLRGYRDRLQLLSACRQAMQAELSTGGRRKSDSTVQFFAFWEVDYAVQLWRKDAASTAEALQRYSQLVQKLVWDAGGALVHQSTDFFIAAFPDMAPALRYLLRLHDALLLLDWARTLLFHPEACAIPGPDAAAPFLWRGLRLRSGCCAGTAAVMNKVAASFNSMLERTQGMLDVCHGGLLVCCERVANMLRHPDFIPLVPPDTAVQKYTTVTLGSGAVQPVFHVVTPMLQQRLFYQTSRTLRGVAQPRLTGHWQEEEAELRGRLESIEHMDAQLRSLPPCNSAPPPPGPDVCFVFIHIQGALSLWEGNPTEMLRYVCLYITTTRGSVTEHRGFEVQQQGDSFWLAFASPADAVDFGTDLHERLVDAPWTLRLLRHQDAASQIGLNGTALFRGLRARIGIAKGRSHVHIDLVADRVLYYGAAVGRAAGLAHLAQGGETLVEASLLEDPEVSMIVAEKCKAQQLGPVTLPGPRAVTVAVARVLPIALESRAALFKSPSQQPQPKPLPIEAWWSSHSHHTQPPELPPGLLEGDQRSSLWEEAEAERGPNPLSALVEDIDLIKTPSPFRDAMAELAKQLRKRSAFLHEHLLAIDATRAATEERLASQRFNSMAWLPEARRRQQELRVMAQRTQRLAEFLHSGAALVEGLNSIFPSLIEEYERNAYGTMSPVVAPAEGVSLERYRRALYASLVVQARIEAHERHLMAAEDTRLHLQNDPAVIHLQDLRPTTLQPAADAVRTLRRRTVPIASAAVSMYWLHREVTGFLALLRRYIRPERAVDALTDDQFVEKWIEVYNTLQVQSGQPRDPTPAPTQFIQQQVWAPSDELPASEDHDAMRRAVVGLLLKFFLFVKRTGTTRAAGTHGHRQPATSEDGLQLLVPGGSRKSSAASSGGRTPRRNGSAGRDRSSSKPSTGDG